MASFAMLWVQRNATVHNMPDGSYQTAGREHLYDNLFIYTLSNELFNIIFL
jgi:hypothetical protein